MDDIFYRFDNCSGVPACVYWLSDRAKRELYCVIGPGQFVDVNTYQGHCWIFENALTGDSLVVNGNCVLIPGEWKRYVRRFIEANSTGRLPRQRWAITQPLYTLRGLALNAVRDALVAFPSANELFLPKPLKDELVHLEKKRACISLHKNGCSCCPFDVHNAHFYHKCNFPKCLSLLPESTCGQLVRLPHGRVTSVPAKS